MTKKPRNYVHIRNALTKQWEIKIVCGILGTQ